MLGFMWAFTGKQLLFMGAEMGDEREWSEERGLDWDLLQDPQFGGIKTLVLIAAAACELHPNAVLKGIEMQSTKDRLREATREAYERGVRGVPTIAVGEELFWGDDRLEDAAAALTG